MHVQKEVVLVFTQIILFMELGSCMFMCHWNATRTNTNLSVWSHVFSFYCVLLQKPGLDVEKWTEVSTHLQRCFFILMPPFSFVYKPIPMHCSVWHYLSNSRYVLIRRLRLKRLHHFIIIPPSGASCPSVCSTSICSFPFSHNHSIHLPCCHESL